MKSLILIASIGSLSSVAFAQTILNSSFESPVLAPGGFQEGNPPTSWTECCGASGTSGGGIVTNTSAYGNSAAPDGTQALLLKSSGGVTQTLSGFTAGTTYTLSFDAEGRGGVFGPNPIEVFVGGTLLSFGGSTTLTPASSTVYTPYTSAPFTVSTTTPVLEFLGTAPSDLSSFVDAVSVSAVPEPSTWMAAAGLGLLAAGDMRRRWKA